MKIIDLSKGKMIIYDCENSKTDLTLASVGGQATITWTPDFAYKEDALEDTDDLLIIVNSALLGNVNVSNTSLVIDDSTPIDVSVTSTVIAAADHVILTADDTGIIAGGVAITTLNTPLSVLQYSQLHVFVGNTGQSTSVTIKCRGKPTAASTMWEDLAVITLGVAPANKAGTCIIDFPAYVYFDIINNDAVNGAAIALSVQGK